MRTSVDGGDCAVGACARRGAAGRVHHGWAPTGRRCAPAGVPPPNAREPRVTGARIRGHWSLARRSGGDGSHGLKTLEFGSTDLAEPAAAARILRHWFWGSRISTHRFLGSRISTHRFLGRRISTHRFLDDGSPRTGSCGHGSPRTSPTAADLRAPIHGSPGTFPSSTTPADSAKKAGNNDDHPINLH
jgi:hypothetical protein